MVEKVIHITSDYEERLRRCQYVRRMSFGRRMMRDDCAPKRFFHMYSFCDESMVIQYLKGIGLLWSKMQCNNCGRDVTWLGLVLFFNNLSPLALFRSFLVQIHSYNIHHPKVRHGVIFSITFHHPLHSSYKFIPRANSFLQYSSSQGYIWCYFFNNLSPPASFLTQIHSFPHYHHPTALCCLLLLHFPYVTHKKHRYTTVAD